MSKSLFAFVFFATGWGPTEGGINAVNFDLCNAMGDKSLEKHSDIYCVFSGTEPLDKEKINAKGHNVTLFHVNEEDFRICNFDAVLAQIPIKEYERIFWIGHDIISGKQALECKNKAHWGKVVLFHHMHYIDYYALAKPADMCEQKDAAQRDMFAEADYAIAIGPQLYDSLIHNIVVSTESLTKCGQVIPGVANITPVNQITRNPMTVLFTGRLEEDNDPIKQFTVPLLAVSDLVREHHYTTNDIAIKLIGLKAEDLKTQETNLKNQAQKRAGCIVNVLPLKYTSSRDALFNIIKRSMVSVMPSISEGFGLSAYESIAAGVPTIISTNSGLYKFLQNIKLEKFVYGINVTGNKNLDVKTVKECIDSIITFLHESKQRAIELKDKLVELGYTWEKTAEDTYSFLLAEISELTLSLKAMISNNAYQFLEENEAGDCVFSAANSCANQLVEDLKVDKNIVLSKSVDKLYSVKNGYNINNGLIQNRIKIFLENIVNELKENDAPDDILVNFTNISKVLANEPEENTDFKDEASMDQLEKVLARKFKKEIKEIITSLKIDAVVTKDDEKALKEYHNKLLTNPEYYTIDFRGVAVVFSDDPTKCKVKLKDIYVPIELKEDLFNIRSRRQRDIDYFESSNRLIIVGDPGSGKSTYLKNKLLEHCHSNSKHMYVFIKVADFVKQIDVTAEQNNENLLEKYIETIIKEQQATNLYTKLKAVGGVDYYIDGLDEVQDSRKKENINREIIEFIRKSNDCKFFITSRKIGLDVQPFSALDFELREIAPLSPLSIDKYIENWYNFISKINEKNYKDYIERLKAAIAQDKALGTLASNPLLLSIIAILHYHGKKLPNNKAALYKTITETLLQTWMEHRNFTVLKDLQNLDNQDLTNIFSRAAYWMIENKYGEMAIGECRLGTIYEDYCNEKKKGIKTPAKKRLLDYISQEAGIVVDGGNADGESLYQFLMHRQFAEYYAAMELDHILTAADGNLVEQLTKVLDEPKWAEVSILMCDHLHTSGESGDIKVQNYIATLFAIKSKPVEDFQTNIQLILKWIINGVVLNEKIMHQLFKCLNEIFRSPNRFRAIQFSEDTIKAFADSTNSWYQQEFYNFIISLIDSGEYNSVRNAAIILNLLLKHEKPYRNILKTITESEIAKALKMVIEDNDFYQLARNDGCYSTLFQEKFITCVNQYFDGANDKNIWLNYTAIYAFVRKRNTQMTNIEKFLEDETKFFKNDTVRDEFIQSTIYWYITLDIANDSEAEMDKWCLDMNKWGCQSIIESASTINKKADIGQFCSNYLGSNVRLYHMKKAGQHIFTLFLYNRDKKNVEKHQIILPCKFSLEYLRKQIDNEGIKAYLSEFNYLKMLKEPEMTNEELKELFDQTFETNRLLTGAAWNQFVVDKIAENGEVFYKYFDLIKREIEPSGIDISHLNGEYKIYFKYLFAKRRGLLDLFGWTTDNEVMLQYEIVGIEDKEQIISLYRQTEDEKHKAVLYEILYNLRNIE